MTTGAERLLQVLSDSGVKYIFGNPGTTEMPIMHALRQFPEMTYVLGLQETASLPWRTDTPNRVVAQHSSIFIRRVPRACHGRSSSFSNRQDAYGRHGWPAGYQTQRSDPLLYGNAVGMAAPVVKWAREVLHPHQIAPLLRRGLEATMTPPLGPVFLSLPIDVLTERRLIL